MAELPSRDRLQPSLLDRLTDHQPLQSSETVEARVLSRQQLRAAILRDLSWLFNAIRPQPEPASTRLEELELWGRNKEACSSVLNFGMPAFAGSTKSSLNRVAMEAAIRLAVTTFEPRIDAKTLTVKIDIDAKNHHNTLQLTMRGNMWAQPVPLELLLAADVDLETGNTQVRAMR
ncbi:MAG: type VI secretion system baseplate subunit TssE [Caldimonas sp.]